MKVYIKTILVLLSIMNSLLIASGLQVKSLLCDYQIDAIGIDSEQPNLSWELCSDQRGAKQSAFRILVSTSKSLLDNNTGDLWDTGKVVSNKQLHITYDGLPLHSSQRVFWKIMAWDNNNQPGEWSEAGTWTMGLLAQQDWQGNWITHGNSEQNLDECNWIWYQEDTPAGLSPPGKRYFRKDFSIDNPGDLSSAVLLVTTDNRCTVYLNGAIIAESNNWQTLTSQVITDSLQTGKNTIAILAGNDGSTDNPAGVLGNLKLHFTNGSQLVIPFDETWKSAKQHNKGWEQTDFNDNSWPKARCLGSYGIEPWGTQVSIVESLPIFRRELVIKPGFERALIHICGLGHYVLSVNGVKVGDSLLTPGWTKYDKTCLYNTFDLTSYLNVGDNAVGVMLGNGMYNVTGGRYAKFKGSFGNPKLIAQVHLFYEDGSSDILCTDQHWQNNNGPVKFSCVYGGEDYDARLEIANWDKPGLDDSTWKSSEITTGPGGRLFGSSHDAPPIKAIEINQVSSIKSISDSKEIYDFAQNASHMPNLSVHGPAGSKIKLTPGELLKADGSLSQSSGGGPTYMTYTLSGKEVENWSPAFFYRGYRYLLVERIASKNSSVLPEIDSIDSIVVHSSSEPVGSFHCSYDLFNRVHNLIRWAQRSNLVSVITDCPHRERLGWLEQYHLHGPSLRYEFDLSQLYIKTMKDMADSQTPDGLIPDIAPEYVVFSGGFRDSPEWGSSLIHVPWQQYQWTGDDRLLNEYYDTMKKYINYLNTKSVNYILDFGLADWGELGIKTPAALTATAYYYANADIMASVSKHLGHTDDYKTFRALAENIRTSFNNKFYDNSQGHYLPDTQTAQALPLAFGIVEPQFHGSTVKALIRNIRKNGLTAGDIGHRYLLRTLADAGRSDVIFELHSKSDKPGYGYILNLGATSLPEFWDGGSSQNHFMLGHIMEWFYHDLAGIGQAADSVGFRKLAIKPTIVDGITSAGASYKCPYGLIKSNWQISDGTFILNIEIPVNTTAKVYLPTDKSEMVKEGGTPVGKAKGVTYLGMENGNSVFKVQTGTYSFRAYVNAKKRTVP